MIETPKGSSNKYTYSDAFGSFEFKMVLPDGTSFPYDFGMVPSTKGADGDPLDILILLDALAFPGCVLEARVVGVIEVDQRERDGSWERNDRLVGVAVKARTHAHIGALQDLRQRATEATTSRATAAASVGVITYAPVQFIRVIGCASARQELDRHPILVSDSNKQT